MRKKDSRKKPSLEPRRPWLFRPIIPMFSNLPPKPMRLWAIAARPSTTLTELSRMATLSTNSRTPLSSTICCPIRIFGPSLGSRIRKRENEYDSRTKKGQTRRSSIRDHHNFQSIQWLRFQSSQHGISRPWPRAIHSAPDLLGLDFREQRFGERFHVRAIRS